MTEAALSMNNETVIVKPTTQRQRLKLHKIPFLAYLEPEQREELRNLSLRTNVPQQVYIREGLSLVLKRHRAPPAAPPSPE